MKTTVLGVRLNDYQREQLKKVAGENKEADVVRELIESVINGDIQIVRGHVEIAREDGPDLTGLQKIADKKRISLQGLIDAITEQLDR